MKRYEDVYMKKGADWGINPTNLCKMIINLHLTEGMGLKTLIDIGCGSGGDSIEFAHNGYAVTGVDISDNALENVAQWAKAEDLNVVTKQADMNDFHLDMRYDVVYSSSSLTFLKKEKRSDILQNYKRRTSTGGINAISVIVEKPFLERQEHVSQDEYMFRSGELMEYYWDWDFIYLSENIVPCIIGGSSHLHAMNAMIARKI